MLSCPNCGGNLKFDIPSQQLSCEHCHTLFDPYDFDGKTSDAEESKTFDGDYEVTIFTCPQCGGEILSTDNAAAGFCSFCGASTILYSRISHEKRPNYIIPFQKTKEQCKEAYARRMKHSIFAPKELRDPSYIDSFRGIYMPYWAFYISQKGSLSLNGKKTSRRGDYIITDHYALTGDLDAYYKGLSYDASSSFDDNISEELAPYNLKGMKAFTPAYLSGFYADTSDVDAKVYQGDAEYTASAETTERIASDGTFADFTMDTIRPEQLHTKTETIDSTMFPVWFLSYRKKDRVTDVLSFPLGQNGHYDTNKETGCALLGDVVISLETAMKQARMYGHSLEREIGFLTVHSMLHLLGYDHETSPLEERQMREKEEEVLGALGISREATFTQTEGLDS